MFGSQDFYQSKYSLLHKVLEKRRGIPISLAVVYREVCAQTRVVGERRTQWMYLFFLRVESRSLQNWAELGVAPEHMNVWILQ